MDKIGKVEHFQMQQGEVPGTPSWTLGTPQNNSLRLTAFHPETINKVAFHTLLLLFQPLPSPPTRGFNILGHS